MTKPMTTNSHSDSARGAAPQQSVGTLRRLIFYAMQRADDFVIVLDYVDTKGASTRRVVSPIRFLGGDRFLALCLSREEPRQFVISRCCNLRLDRAHNYVMPVVIAATA